MNTTPSTPARHPTRDEIADAARHKLMTYKMKPAAPPGASPPQIPKPPSAITTPRNNRHSRGPSLSSPASNPQRHSPPLASSTPQSRPQSAQTASSRPVSHHRRNSSLSTRRESREIMGGALSLPSSPQTNNEQPSGREGALLALEGRRPLSFVNGFEQVVVPDWKTPTVETHFDWPIPTKSAVVPTPAFGSASLAGKRDSFGKNLVAAASIKDQLQTLLEEEEEEEEATPAVKKLPGPSMSLSLQRQRPTNLRLEPSAPILPASTKYATEPVRAARLRPLSLAASLPSPALTPSPRLSSLGMEPSSPPIGTGAFQISPIRMASPTTPSPPVLRPLSLAATTLTPSPPTPSASPSGQLGMFSPRSGPVSSSGSMDSVKQMRRMSTLSYRSSQSSSGGGGGRVSPAFSLASSAAMESAPAKSPSPATPNLERAVSLQVTYLQQENATLLGRITSLEKSLEQKEKQEDISEHLRLRIADLERQVEHLKTCVDKERKEASSAKEVARRLSERVWEFERARDAASILSSNPASPPLPHSKGTSASSPRSLISGRPASGASSFWGGSVGNQSVGSMTDVEEPWGPPVASGDLDVLPEEDENEESEVERVEEEEEAQEVDSAEDVGIQVSLLPETTSSAGYASAPSSPGSSTRDSVSAYSLSSTSTSEAEAQSLAVLESMAAEGDSFVEPAEGWMAGLEELEEDSEARAEQHDSVSSLPNPYGQDPVVQPSLAAAPPMALSALAVPPTPTTPSTPTPRTPTVASVQAAAASQHPVSKPSPHPAKHAKTASQAQMMSWKFPSGAVPVSKAEVEENDKFFASLDEEPKLRPMGKPMGRKERRKKSIMRPYLGDDDFDDIQIASAVPAPASAVVLQPPPTKDAFRARPGAISPSAKPRASSPTSAPAPTWSVRTPSPPRATYSPSSVRNQVQPRQPASPSPPPSASSGFSFTKLTSVFSSWVAPPPPSPAVPKIMISTPIAMPASQPAAYFAPADAPPRASPGKKSRTVLPARAVGRDSQPQPYPSPLEKLDFRGAGCRHCEGDVIEL